MHLEGVDPALGAAVILDQGREEMELDVRVPHARGRADEAAGLEMRARRRAIVEQEPAQADRDHVVRAHGVEERDGLRALDLKIELERVLELAADAGQVVGDRHADPPQLVRRANAREQQELGRVDGAAGQDHLARRHGPLEEPALGILDPDGAAALQQDPGGDTARYRRS